MMTLREWLKALLAGGKELDGHRTTLQRLLDSVRNVDPNVAAKMVKLKDESEPFRLMDAAHHAHVAAGFTAQWSKSRTLAAGVGRYLLEPKIAPLEAEVRSFEGRCRQDVYRSFPDDNPSITTSGDGVLLAAILREQLRVTRGPELKAAAPGERLRVYHAALSSPHDPCSPMLASLIEDIVERGDGASSGPELPHAIELRRHVDETRALRIPLETLEVRGTIDAARKLVSLADTMKIRPARPDAEPEAAKAFEAEEALVGSRA